MACFERDIAGALGLHRADVVQYVRPEIIGFVLGSLIAAYSFKEFRLRVGPAPIVRFVLGAFAMIGALVFLGCPWLALLRLAGVTAMQSWAWSVWYSASGSGPCSLKADITWGARKKPILRWGGCYRLSWQGSDRSFVLPLNSQNTRRRVAIKIY